MVTLKVEKITQKGQKAFSKRSMLIKLQLPSSALEQQQTAGYDLLTLL